MYIFVEDSNKVQVKLLQLKKTNKIVYYNSTSVGANLHIHNISIF